MDDIDRTIINEIQSAFPISPRPYLELGERLHLSESEVFNRVKRLKREGVIRRIGGNFDSRKLNFTSTLCAARVPDDKIDRFVEVVNGFPIQKNCRYPFLNVIGCQSELTAQKRLYAGANLDC